MLSFVVFILYNRNQGGDKMYSNFFTQNHNNYQSYSNLPPSVYYDYIDQNTETIKAIHALNDFKESFSKLDENHRNIVAWRCIEEMLK